MTYISYSYIINYMNKKYNTIQEAKAGRKLKDRERYLKNRELRIKRACEWKKQWRKENPELAKIEDKKSYERIKNDPVRRKKYNDKKKKLIQDRRLEVIKHYSTGKMVCSCCGEKHIEFLCMDHINNDGAKHRKEYKGSIYTWLINNNFPDGFQILCCNCNSAKEIYGKCPHQN